MTIATKYTVALLACVVVGVLGNAALAVHDELARSDEAIVEHEATTANALRPAIRDVWLHDGEARALALVAEAQQRLRNVEVRLISLDPDAVAERKPHVPASLLAQLEPGRDVVIVDRSYEGAGRIFTYVRVHFPEPAAAAIEVSQSLVSHAAVRAEVLRGAVLTALGIALASGLVTYLLGVILVSRPLSVLVARAHRIGGGDLSCHIPVRQTDEIGALGREMNRMCARLHDARESERAQASQLRHADRLATVGRLAAGLAHELGTPLNVVHARARQLAAGTLDPDDVRSRSRIIVEQAARMTALIRQLLDFARKRELQPAEVDIRTLIDRAVGLLEPIVRKHGVSVEILNEATPARGRVDPEQVTQVLLNLVMNAVQATAPGKTIAVTLSRGLSKPPAEDGRSEQPCLRIDVRDEGTGISPDAISHIFEPFYTTKDVGEGTGLGLSVAYGIVKDHGGWLDVESALGHGSTFTVWLPEAGPR